MEPPLLACPYCSTFLEINEDGQFICPDCDYNAGSTVTIP